MKKFIFMTGLICLMVGMSACKSNKEASGTSTSVGDNSRNSLDWAGTYSGIVPCADCPGIETQITLYSNNTYKMSRQYMDQGGITYNYDGNFQWSSDGSTITLRNLDEEGVNTHFKVGENILIQLDLKGKEIKGNLASNYVLTKVNLDIVERYWKLYEIFGQPVDDMEPKLMKDAFITLKMDGNRVTGNGGCNGLTGTYELMSGNRIKFSQMASTMMMCPNMEVEQKLTEVLEKADNYYVNGDTLILNRARMAPLARFKAVYMK